jgi:hypothetical protein
MFQGRLVPGIKVLPAGNGPVPTAGAASTPSLDPTSPAIGQMAGGVPIIPPASAPGGASLGGPDSDDEIPF